MTRTGGGTIDGGGGSVNGSGVTGGNGRVTAAAAAGGGGSKGVVPACNKFLRALGDAGRIDDAVTAYEAMTKSDLLPTIVTFSTLISRCGRSFFMC